MAHTAAKKMIIRTKFNTKEFRSFDKIVKKIKGSCNDEKGENMVTRVVTKTVNNRMVIVVRMHDFIN